MPSPTAFRDIKMWKRFFNRFDNMKWFLFQQAFKLRARKQANSVRLSLIGYVESQYSEAGKGISLNANWNCFR